MAALDRQNIREAAQALFDQYLGPEACFFLALFEDELLLIVVVSLLSRLVTCLFDTSQLTCTKLLFKELYYNNAQYFAGGHTNSY